MTSPGSLSPTVQDPTAHAVALDLNRLDELFRAPDANPFSTHEIEVLGQSGIDYLRKHSAQRWPRQLAAHELIIRLPPEAYENGGGQSGFEELSHRTQIAIRRFCNERIGENQQKKQLAILTARDQLLIALLVAVFAGGMLALLFSSGLNERYPHLQLILTLLAVFAASLTLWDALESLFFDWVPYMVENHAYSWIAGLAVRIAAIPQYYNESTTE